MYKKLPTFLFFIAMLSILFGTTAIPKELEPLVGTVQLVKCTIIGTLLPLVAVLLLVLAGISYAVGGLFGAEIRAKAHGYAMALLLGAFIGFLLWALAGPVVEAMWPAYRELVGKVAC